MAVSEVRWAQPFVLSEPTPWTMGKDRAPLERGWLVEVAAPAALLQARAVGQQVLFADAQPVRPLHAPLTADCSLVVVPADVDVDDKLVDVRWYFGSTTLPERVDAEHGAWELQVAVDAGIQPLAPTTVVAPASYDDLRDLADVAEARFRRCRADAEPPPAPNTF